MTGRYQPYTEYSETGIPWLGTAPSHWIFSRIKFPSTLNPSKSEARSLPGDREVSFLPMEAIGEDSSLDTSRVKSLAEVLDGYSYVAEGDVMIAKITPCFENGKGAIAKNLCNGIGFATTEVIVIRPSDQRDSSFLYYLLSSKPFRSIAEGSMYGAGGQKRVADSFIANYPIAWPSSAERTTIAAFLDHETAKIDRLIARQERLIELLKEKRQAVISHAVTKGLNPDAPMKDSGVEWLGEVPAHWDTCRAKHLLNFVTSGSRGWAQYYSDQGDLFVRITNLTRDGISVDLGDPQYVLPPKGSEGERSKVKQNDLLISITADLGSVGVATTEVEGAYVSQHVALARPNLRVVSSRWFGYALIANSSKKQFEASGYGGTKIQLSLEDIREIAVSCPPPEEQVLIAKAIDEKLSQYDLLIGKVMIGIKLMNEHRTALISAAVTGKIDVRGWQKPNNEPQEAATAASA